MLTIEIRGMFPSSLFKSFGFPNSLLCGECYACGDDPFAMCAGCSLPEHQGPGAPHRGRLMCKVHAFERTRRADDVGGLTGNDYWYGFWCQRHFEAATKPAPPAPVVVSAVDFGDLEAFEAMEEITRKMHAKACAALGISGRMLDREVRRVIEPDYEAKECSVALNITATANVRL